MTLFSYLQQTQRLIRDVQQKDLNVEDLTIYLNEARVQVAGESISIPAMGTLAVTSGNRGPYLFTSIAFPTASETSGIAGPLNARTIWYQVGDGQKWIRPRPWPWFSLYELNNPVPDQGAPAVWTQYGQGVNGSIYINTPDTDYTLMVDTICYPIDLVDDTTVEAVPPLWQTAVPYYAAYLALISAQTGDKDEAADKMFARYTLFVERARKFATPEVLPFNYSQTGSPVRQNQLGIARAEPR
jgi:hypothetical protein